MQSTDLMRADTYGIGELITRYRLLRVPTHQRDYAWTRDEVQQFLDDIIGAIREEADDYFVGLIVLVRPDQDGVWQILDGQQRLATTTMIYAAIRQWLAQAGRDDDEHQVQSTFIGIRELGEVSHRPRLTLNVNNRERFREVVVNQCTDDLLESRRKESGKFSSDRKLIEAAITCRETVAELTKSMASDLGKQAERLYELASYLEKSVKIVCLEVPSTLNAYMIFESLNDRGLDLSILDLLKNYMFGRAGDRLDEVQSNWSRMVALLGDREADDFLKVFWTSRFGRVQRGKLFDELRKKYVDHRDMITLSLELARAAEKYSALGMPEHDVWAEYSKLCRERVGILSLLGNRQTRAIILSALEQFKDQDMEKLLQHLITLTVRYQLVGKGRTGALEIACARVASKVFSSELNTPMKVWKQLSALVPDDVVFQSDFAQLSEPDAPRARYLLRELEIAATRKADPGKPLELGPTTSLTLEHILPKNPSGAWSKELKTDPDLRTTFLHRLGNLCLTEEKLSLKVGSSGFAQKCAAIYSQSQLRLTGEVANYENWNRRSIEERQAGMARLAVAAWPLPQETQA
jgi:hypothetical protein